MFLKPKKLKFKKPRKGKLKNLELKTNDIKFGCYAIKTTESGLINAKQLEAARRSITKKLMKKGKTWLRIFPDHPVCKKPSESRMGKGKGSVSHWVAKVGNGTVIFEITGVPKNIAQEALKSGGYKLCLKTKFVC